MATLQRYHRERLDEADQQVSGKAQTRMRQRPIRARGLPIFGSQGSPPPHRNDHVNHRLFRFHSLEVMT
jgi:hypothetical protein